MNDTENIVSSSAFNLTDRLQIFSYLVSSNRARCIGKATRLRARQRELDTLKQPRTQLYADLRDLTDRLAHHARYLMIQAKGSPVATASASFWTDRSI